MPHDHTRCEQEIRFLKRYVAVATAAFGVVVLGGFAGTMRQKQRFTEIDVERINVVEKDGTLRLTISNRARGPDVKMGGKTFSRSGGNHAGFIFYNEEGDENGGLAFRGETVDGRYQASGSLMFDQYRQDQTIGISYADDNGRRSAALRVWDRPNTPVVEMASRLQPIKDMPAGPEKDRLMAAARAEARARGEAGAERVMVGKTPDRTAAVILSDRMGVPRLRLAVDSNGVAGIEFLDPAGKVTRRIAAQ